jgi:hypothetical protein
MPWDPGVATPARNNCTKSSKVDEASLPDQPQQLNNSPSFSLQNRVCDISAIDVEPYDEQFELELVERQGSDHSDNPNTSEVPSAVETPCDTSPSLLQPASSQRCSSNSVGAVVAAASTDSSVLNNDSTMTAKQIKMKVAPDARWTLHLWEGTFDKVAMRPRFD